MKRIEVSFPVYPLFILLVIAISNIFINNIIVTILINIAFVSIFSIPVYLYFKNYFESVKR